MASFKGKETYSIDDKGRVNIPVKMRKCIPDSAENTFVVMRGLEKCIFAYPINIWEEKQEKKLEELNQYDERSRKIMRLMLQNCEEVELDKQQRINLPEELLNFANIDSKVTIIGMLDHIEFWDPETYDAYINDCSESYEIVAAKVMLDNKDI